MYKTVTLAVLALSSVVAAVDDAPALRGGMKPIVGRQAVPAALRIRQSGKCDLLSTECGGECYDITAQCCADNKTACDILDTCQKGDDGRYGCCDFGASCVGSAPPDDDTGSGSGGSGSGGSGSSPTRTYDIGDIIPTYTPGTGSSGGSGGSGSKDTDTLFAVPSNTGLGGVGGSGASPTGSSGSSGAGSAGLSEACQSAAAEMNKNPAPTPPPDLAKAIAANKDLCKFDPGSLSNEWSSYTKAANSWQKDNKDVLEKVNKECSSGENKIPDLSKCGGAGAVTVGKGAVVAALVAGVVAALL